MNKDRATSKPGQFESLDCGICGTTMDVKRNVNGPTNFASAMSGNKYLHDSFTCPHIDEMWHLQAKKIQKMANKSPSKITEKMLLNEAADIIAKQQETKAVSEFF